MATAAARSAARIGASTAAAAVVAASAILAGGQGRARPATPEVPTAARVIDINTAGADELALLPGIGPRIAGRIVSDRTGRGPFASVDELRRVNGIGAATLERIRPFATAGQTA